MHTAIHAEQNFREQYVIGDIQGCYTVLQALLKKLHFDPTRDKLWFAGDLVARGNHSLATLRYIKSLCEQGAAETVLGNHDIHLIAVWRGLGKLKKKDKTGEIFAAEDCDNLLNWLRQQPLLLLPDDKTALVHAGIPPCWRIEAARIYALEVHNQLSSSLWQLDRFLAHLYGSKPDTWSDELSGYARVRCITNYFTRMRLCKANGQLEFSFKSNTNNHMPSGFKPWFDWQVARERKILFGHWAALEGKVNLPHARALDGGCVWGGKLLAYRLRDGRVIGC